LVEFPKGRIRKAARVEGENGLPPVFLNVTSGKIRGKEESVPKRKLFMERRSPRPWENDGAGEA